MDKKRAALIILDGFGVAPESERNAINRENCPYFYKLKETYPCTTLTACGESVGLPDGQMGNSEVGHQHIGAGRIVPQELQKINSDIESGVFFKNAEFNRVAEYCREKGSALHIMGLISPGGVHSHINHLFALLKLIKKTGIEKVYIHCFTDGRDTAPDSAGEYIAELEKAICETGCGRIASVSGRYYAMDRDANFGRMQLAYDAITDCKGERYKCADDIIKESYDKGIKDEFIVPSVVEGAQPMQDNDGVIFINFRPDRAVQLMKALLFSDDELKEWYAIEDRKKESSYNSQMADKIAAGEIAESDASPYTHMPHFVRRRRIEGLYVVAMAEYDESIDSRMHIAYNKAQIPNTLGEVLSKHGYTQLRIAETEKFRHVTSFISGNRQALFEGEKRELINSPSVATYDLKPEMSAYEVAGACVEHIMNDDFDFIILNFANPDMVGHTGRKQAVIDAIQVVDKCLKQVVEAMLSRGGMCFVTADHGNADEMITKSGKVSTQHSLNPVPFICVNPDMRDIKLKSGGALYNIAPTILDVLGLQKPEDMTGESLIIKAE